MHGFKCCTQYINVGVYLCIVTQYINTKSVESTEDFDVKSGVKQGSVLSPILLNVVMENIARGIKERTTDAQFMIFTDEFMLWGDKV